MSGRCLDGVLTSGHCPDGVCMVSEPCLQYLLYCSFDMESRIFISYSIENWDSYVQYKTISERYQGAERYFFLYRICVFITFNCTVVNCHVKLSTKHILFVCLHFSQFITFSIVVLLFFYIFIDKSIA